MMAASRLLRRSIPRTLTTLHHTSKLSPNLILLRAGSTLSSHDPSTGAPLPLQPAEAPLSRLPTPSLLRGLLLHSVSASPRLLDLSTKVLLSQATHLDRNKPLKYLIDKTFYAHFCCGSTEPEIRATVAHLRSLGITGIILSYAREILLSDPPSPTAIPTFLSGMLNTVAYTDPGDFVALKYTGAGHSCLPLLTSRQSCTLNPELGASVFQICDAAKARRVRLLVDAEHADLQEGIDDWTLELMRRYNTDKEAVVWNTYQMYLRRSPETLQRHLEIARREGWRLGVKLVRGAYLASDPRELIHPTKEATDAAYDAAARWLITGTPTPGLFDTPRDVGTKVDLMIATHNAASIDTVRKLPGKEGVGRLVYAQLMGMADEISLGIVNSAKDEEVYKYAVWGTTEECVRYLVRRAQENRDATARSIDNVKESWGEVRRRIGL